METRFKQTKEDLIRKHEAYLRDIKPYVNALTNFHNLKVPKIQMNLTTGNLIIDYGPDTPEEANIKIIIADIKEKYGL